MYYKLDSDGNPVRLLNVVEWARWLSNNNRTLADERVGDFRVSTIFLGLDHAMPGEEPQLWETCVFDHSKPKTITLGSSYIETCDSEVLSRYTTSSQAKLGHAAAVGTCVAIMRDRQTKREARRAARKIKP